MKMSPANFLSHPVALIIGVVFAAMLIALSVILAGTSTIEPGEVYLRVGIPDSAMVASIMDVAPNAAGELLVTILAFDRLVQIDQVGPCGIIAQNYAQLPELLPIPVFIEGEDTECYSYRLRFDIRDGTELLNLELALIHPADHMDLLEEKP